MKKLFIVLISLLTFNVFAEYKPEEINPSDSYAVDFEVNNKEDKSRNVAAKPVNADDKNYEEEVEPSREVVPFWDFKKEKF